MLLTNSDLQYLYATANRIFYDLTLPPLEVFFSDTGTSWGVCSLRLIGEPRVDYITISEDLQTEHESGHYSALLVSTVLHEMVHEALFEAGDMFGGGGGNGVIHSPEFAEFSDAHGLKSFWDCWEDDVLQYIPDESAERFERFGIIIDDMEREQETAYSTEADGESFAQWIVNRPGKLARLRRVQQDVNNKVAERAREAKAWREILTS